MLRSLARLLSLALLALPALAQAPDAAQVQKLNQEAIQALVAKDFDTGIAKLMQILELLPEDKGTAYNLACAYSLKGEVDASYGWLEKGYEWGWGGGSGSIYGMDGKTFTEADMCLNDPDLENVRKDPRFAPLIEKMRARARAVEEYAAGAVVHVPEKVKDLEEKPLLVVVHGQGSTKDEVAKSFWRAIADDLGLVLIAPSGQSIAPGARRPEDGMTWFESVPAYEQRPFLYEKPIQEAINAFKKEHKIDRKRIYIAGEGLGGTVAINAAVSSPYQYKGAISIGGPVMGSIVGPKAQNASKAGQKVCVLLDRAGAAEDPEGGAKLEAIVKQLGDQLAGWSLGTVETFESKADAPAEVESGLVRAKLRGWLDAAQTVEAGSETGRKF